MQNVFLQFKIKATSVSTRMEFKGVLVQAASAFAVFVSCSLFLSFSFVFVWHVLFTILPVAHFFVLLLLFLWNMCYFLRYQYISLSFILSYLFISLTFFNSFPSVVTFVFSTFLSLFLFLIGIICSSSI